MSNYKNTLYAEHIAELLEEAGYEVADVDTINHTAKVKAEAGICRNINQCCDDEMCYCTKFQVVDYQPLLKSAEYAKVHQFN